MLLKTVASWQYCIDCNTTRHLQPCRALMMKCLEVQACPDKKLPFCFQFSVEDFLRLTVLGSSTYLCHPAEKSTSKIRLSQNQLRKQKNRDGSYLLNICSCKQKWIQICLFLHVRLSSLHVCLTSHVCLSLFIFISLLSLLNALGVVCCWTVRVVVVVVDVAVCVVLFFLSRTEKKIGTC